MTNIDARIMVVVGALRQSILTSNQPGLSVNTHPNPFMLSVIGALDLRTAAELVLKRLDETFIVAKETAAPPAPATDEG
jgi:hypothetical protein